MNKEKLPSGLYYIDFANLVKIEKISNLSIKLTYMNIDYSVGTFGSHLGYYTEELYYQSDHDCVLDYYFINNKVDQLWTIKKNSL